MEQKTFYIQTFGCQMNERDSETLAGFLSGMGYHENPVRNKADVIIINTCSVRENADKRFFGTLGQLKKLREEKADLVVAVCGCMMQQQHIIDALKSKYPWVDLIFGTHNIHEFPRLLTNVIEEKAKIVAVWEEAEDIHEDLPSARKHPFKAYVNITYGCDNFCTYCIVPYTRGRERSREPEQIIREIESLVAEGVKEVTLLGQNVNSYFSHETDFGKLIRLINAIEGLERIRFMTSHPKDVSEELISAFGECEKLCPHIHLPIQSGSSRILEKMNRRYSAEDYLTLVDKLKKTLPEIAISTDIIVGFPGETEEDFQETLDLISKVEFDSAFTFLYSVRKGTPAEKYTDQVEEEVKHERFNRLVDLVNGISAKKNKALVGTVEKVLVEGKSKTNPKLYTGRTGGHKLVNFSGKAEDIGHIVPVFITESGTFSLTGEGV